MHKNAENNSCIKMQKKEYLFFFKKGLQSVALSFSIRITNSKRVGKNKKGGH